MAKWKAYQKEMKRELLRVPASGYWKEQLLEKYWEYWSVKQMEPEWADLAHNLEPLKAERKEKRWGLLWD